MSPASRGIDVEKDEKDNDPGIPIPSHAPQNWGHQQGRLVRERGVRYAPPKKDSKMHTTCRSCIKFVCKCARSPTALPVVTCVTRRIVGQFDLEDAACLHKAGAAGGLKKVVSCPSGVEECVHSRSVCLCSGPEAQRASLCCSYSNAEDGSS